MSPTVIAFRSLRDAAEQGAQVEPAFVHRSLAQYDAHEFIRSTRRRVAQATAARGAIRPGKVGAR